MHKYFKPIRYSLIICFTLFLMASCNNGGDDKKDAATSIADTISKTTDVKEEPSKKRVLTGTLDYLWIESDTFNVLPHKQLVLSFRFETNDSLTLHGWTCRGLVCTGSYETDPIIKLRNSKAGSINFGPKIYFGNVILRRDEIRRIQNKYSSKYKYVIFIPKIINEFIYYSIVVTNDDPSKSIKALTTVDTFEEANPSPPKDY